MATFTTLNECRLTPLISAPGRKALVLRCCGVSTNTLGGKEGCLLSCVAGTIKIRREKCCNVLYCFVVLSCVAGALYKHSWGKEGGSVVLRAALLSLLCCVVLCCQQEGSL